MSTISDPDSETIVGQSVPDRANVADYPPWTTSWLLRLVLFERARRSYWASAGIFALYWLLPFILALVHGTVLPQQAILETLRELENNLPDIFVDSSVLQTFADYQKIYPHQSVTYLADKTHLIFAIVIAIGGGLAAHIIKQFNTTIVQLRNVGVPLAEESEVKAIYKAYLSAATHWGFRLVSLVFALITLAIFLYIAKAESNTIWWGHVDYGYTGIIFAFIEAIMVYWGTRVVVLIGMGSLMLVKLMRFPLALRPFHADGCNGLSQLGYQIIYLWLFSLCLAFAIYVVLSLGYLGIENTLIAWLLALIITLAIPGLAVLPLLSALTSIHRARRARLDSFEMVLSNLLTDAEAFARERNSDEAVKSIAHLEKIHNAQKIINTANVWPFNPRALFSILLINVVQIVLTLDKLMGIFSQ